MAPRAEPVNHHDGGEGTIEQAPPPARSVQDFNSVEAVTEALQLMDPISGQKDWELQNYDPATTSVDPNDIEKEAKRLLCLKSYNILDSEKEPEFEAITEEAKRVLDCPIAVVSLVDMGRQWFKSIQGLPVEETPRCVSFCAHVVKRKEEDGILVVPDATKHPSFKDNPIVTGGPQLRFYAGTPLISPEGHRLGSLCVIDMVPHPEGLSDYEKTKLKVLAEEAVYHMILREQK